MLTNFMQALNEVKQGVFRITQMSNGKEAIQQTERNKLKTDLTTALNADINAIYPKTENGNDIVSYFIDGDIVLEVPNESIADKVTNIDGSGAISISISVKVNGLEYNAEVASEDYLAKVAEKEAKKRAEAEKKAKKIAKDKAMREAKAKAKEEKGE